MDPVLIQALATLIFGGTGIVGVITGRKVWKQKKRSAPADERVARRVVDNSALNKYWLSELAQARADRKDELENLRRQIRNLQEALQEQTLSDADRIDQLEEWIWLKKPPPPPPKKKTMRDQQ